MLKECLWNMFDDNERISDAVGTGSQNYKTFKRVTSSILSTVSRFLADIQKCLMCPGIWIGFAKQELASRSSKVFTESGLPGMLEASIYEAVNIVSPFTGATIDECWGLDKTAYITQVFAVYVDTVSLLYLKLLNPKSSKKKWFSFKQNLVLQSFCMPGT